MRMKNGMRIRITLVLIITTILLCSPWYPRLIQVKAQPEEEWNKTFGGTSDDWGASVQQTSDGGYIIVGITFSFGAGNGDVYLIKTDSSGKMLWGKVFGGTDYDEGYSVQQTSDGGYIIVGETRSFGAGNGDVYLIKTDSSGNMRWYKTFGGSNWDLGESVQQTSDGGYIIVGSTTSFGAIGFDVYLIKTDSSGNRQWEKTFGGTRNDYGHSVQQTSDGGYIIVGGTLSSGAGHSDIYLVKTDSNGNKQWEKTFGGTDYDVGYSVQQTSDGGYIIAGYTLSSGAGSYDIYLIKTGSNGNMQWSKTFGGTGDDECHSVQQTSDGGYIIAGRTKSFGAGGFDVYLIKTDSSGNKQWEKTFGGTKNDVSNSVQQTSDGGYIIAGGTDSFGAGSSDVWLIKLKGPDRTPPVTTIAFEPKHHVGSTTYVSSSTLFELSASDDASGVKETRYRVDNGPWTTYSAGFTLLTLSDGEHTISYYSVDNAGNTEAEKTLTIILDKTPPTISEASPTGTISSTSVTFTVKVEDSGSGVKEVKLIVDGASQGLMSRSGNTYTMTVSLSEGSHTWSIEAVDNVGNTATQKYSFTISTWVSLLPYLIAATIVIVIIATAAILLRRRRAPLPPPPPPP
jgi:hypothetical protein